jgi:uncharacterized delta-60 repeat protein
LEELEERTLLSAGALDPTFGTGGQVVTPFSNSTGVTGLVLQPAGKLVAAGSFGTTLALVRYNTDGTLDTSFGTAGEVTANLGPGGVIGLSGAIGLALQTDGKILVSGTLVNRIENVPSMVVARYLPNGAPDASFGGGSGESVIGQQGMEIAVQPDGKILAAGISSGLGITIHALVIGRLNTNGTEDPAFGTNSSAGVFVPGNVVPIPSGVGVEPNGRIVAVTANDLVGFSSGGTIDSGFGAGGIAHFSNGTLRGMTILPDGRIVVVVNVLAPPTGANFEIARFFGNGIPDASFGTAGVTMIHFGDAASAVAVQPDGRYIVAAYHPPNSRSMQSYFVLERYNPNGALDTTFDDDGVAFTNIAGSSMANQVLVQPDGKAVAAGADSGNFALARYTADTPLPTANQRFVAQVYLDLFGRQVDGAGLAQWSAMLDQGAAQSQVVAQIQSSQEYLMDEVNALYAQYLHRAVDPTGLNGSVNFLRSGGTVEELVTVLVGSPEFTQGQGQGTNDGFLNAFYQDALNHAVDASGRAFWDQAFANHATPSQVAGAILVSAEYRQDVVENAYGLYLRRPPDSTGLNDFTALLNQGTRDEAIFAIIIGSQEYFQRVG